MHAGSKEIALIGFILALTSTLARLSVMGWVAVIGMVSAVVFGILHLFLLRRLYQNFDNADKRAQKMAWAAVLIYPLIFLFQFDFGDGNGTFYVYEFITGENDSKFEGYAFSIAIALAILYITFFAILMKKLSRLNQHGYWAVNP